MLSIVNTNTTKPTAALEQPDRTPFAAAPVLLPDPTDPGREEKRRTHRTATASWLYIMREPGEDRFGKLGGDYLSKRPDLIAHGRRYPVRKTPPQFKAGRLIWDEADAATAADPRDASAIHIVASLAGLPRHEWVGAVERYVDDYLVKEGMIVDYAVHALKGEDGNWAVAPHVHLLCTARRWRIDIRRGRRQPSWLYTKAQTDKAELGWLAISGMPASSFTVD